MAQPQRNGIAKQLRTYQENFAKCRDTRHWWDYDDQVAVRTGPQTLTCKRCGARKTRDFQGFQILKNRIAYPKGYVLRWGPDNKWDRSERSVHVLTALRQRLQTLERGGAVRTALGHRRPVTGPVSS